jgi:hypothetical protein
LISLPATPIIRGVGHFNQDSQTIGQRVCQVAALMIEAPGNYSSAGEQARQALNLFVTRWEHGGCMVDAKTHHPLTSHLSSFAIVLVGMSLKDSAGTIFPTFEATGQHLDRARRNLKKLFYRDATESAIVSAE